MAESSSNLTSNINASSTKIHKKTGLKITDGFFHLDEEPFQIKGGDISYYSIHQNQWRHFVQVAKKCGLNTIATSVPWAFHETKNGYFFFQNSLGSFSNKFSRINKNNSLSQKCFT